LAFDGKLAAFKPRALRKQRVEKRGGLPEKPARLWLASDRYSLARHDSDFMRPAIPDAAFDLVISEYGASIWCDPLLGRGSYVYDVSAET
jgi:hypothetical protein